MRRFVLVLVSSLAGGIIAFAIFFLVFKSVSPTSKEERRTGLVKESTLDSQIDLSAGVRDFTLAAERSIHAVVHIQTLQRKQVDFIDEFYESFLKPYYKRSDSFTTFGSGVIITEDGYIITNHHVIQDADSIRVTLNDRRQYNAVKVGEDPSSDLALIKIQGVKLDPIVFANSDKAKVGQWVLAVGNPFNLTSTITAGIISAKARNINIIAGNSLESPVESFIQTDAVVNPGNSGGALVNTNGELIGINTAIKSKTGSYSGYAFAIPSNIVKKIATDLKEFGLVQRAYLGIQAVEKNTQFVDGDSDNDLHKPGVYIAAVVPNGAGDRAGLMKGDILFEINGKPINSFPDMIEEIAQYRPGQNVQVKFERNGKYQQVEVTLLNKNSTTAVLKVD